MLLPKVQSLTFQMKKLPSYRLLDISDETYFFAATSVPETLNGKIIAHRPEACKRNRIVRFAAQL